MAYRLETMGKDVCVIDLSPINLHPFAQEGIRTIAGDASDVRFLELAEAAESSFSVICISNDETAALMVRAIRKLSSTGTLIVRCRYQSNTHKLCSAGADCVISEETEASIALLRTIISYEQPDPLKP